MVPSPGLKPDTVPYEGTVLIVINYDGKLVLSERIELSIPTYQIGVLPLAL